jgi:uncharacterized membrane protein YfcA
MILKEFFIAFSIAAVLSVSFALLTHRKGKRTGIVWFFLIALMITWAGGIWLQPFGPTWGGARWLPFLVIGVLFSMLAALFSPRKPPRGRHETLEKLEEVAREKELEEITYVTLGMVFWAVLIALLTAIILRHII